MGLAKDTAITTDADLLKYAFEQEISKLLRGANTYTELHKGAINEHIVWLRSAHGIKDPSTITNDSDHEPVVSHMVLMKIMSGKRGAKARDAWEFYRSEVMRLRSELTVETTLATLTRRGLPMVAQEGVGMAIARPGGPGPHVHLGRSDVLLDDSGFEQVVKGVVV